MDASQSARVLLRLGAAFRVDTDQDVLTVWHQQLATMDYALAQEAADQCIRSMDRMPTVAGFLDAAQGVLRQRAAARRQAEQGALVECEECDGSGWVEVGREHVPPTVRPCGRCQPQLHTRWVGGHLMSDHPAYACQDDGCQHRTHRRVGARR